MVMLPHVEIDGSRRNLVGWLQSHRKPFTVGLNKWLWMVALKDSRTSVARRSGVVAVILKDISSSVVGLLIDSLQFLKVCVFVCGVQEME